MIFDLIDYAFGIIKNIMYLFIYLGRYRFSFFSRISSKASVRIYDQGKVNIHKKAVIRSGCILRTHKRGVIVIGENSGLNNNCLLTSFESIIIGNNTIIGQGVKIYDHDHKYKGVSNIKKSGYLIDSVQIGNNVWIGSDCIILKGTVIEDNCVIAAGSIVSGTINKNSLYIQKRNKTIVDNI